MQVRDALTRSRWHDDDDDNDADVGRYLLSTDHKWNKCIEDDTKAAARQIINYIRKTKNKIRRKTIFNMADWILSHCNVARGSGIKCHWIRPNVRHIRILLLVTILTISPQSTSLCTSLRIFFIQIGPPKAEKWHLDFQDGGSPPSWILGVQ